MYCTYQKLMFVASRNETHSQPCSKLELIKILLSAEHGTHIKYPKAEFFRCVAFRLDPISSGSFNDIDGEVVQPGRIQARVVPGKLKFFA